MNIENREEMLKESMSIIETMIPILQAKDLNESSIGVIKEIMELCIKYGFDQGCIHGMYKGQIESCNKLAELLGGKNE